MTSNDMKKKARRLQQESPGMKYTEALRRAGAGAFVAEQKPTPGREAIEHNVATGHLGPIKGLTSRADAVPSDAIVGLSAERTDVPGNLDPFRIEPTTTGSNDASRIVTDEVHDMMATRNQSHERLEALLRKARSGTECGRPKGEFRPLVQRVSDFGDSLETDGHLIYFAPKPPLSPQEAELTEGMRREWERLRSEPAEAADDRRPRFVGRAIGDITSRPVLLDFSALGEETAGVTDEYLWAGHCATEEQARNAYRLIGSPGDEERFIKAVTSLKSPRQFYVIRRDSGWAQIVEIDPDSIAAREAYERQRRNRLEE